MQLTCISPKNHLKCVYIYIQLKLEEEKKILVRNGANMDTRAPSTARIEATLSLFVPSQPFAKPVIACHITTHLPETCPGAYCDEHSGPILELYAYSCLATLNAKSLTVVWAKTPTCFTPSSRCCVFGLKPSYFSNLPLGYLRDP